MVVTGYSIYTVGHVGGRKEMLYLVEISANFDLQCICI